MKELFDKVSASCSKMVTRSYSTSFSLGIYFLDSKIHDAIYAIYGFVRLADEIVDSFHDYEKEILLSNFQRETFEAIQKGISLNPILNSFQSAVNRYNIEDELIVTFLQSMEMDLHSSFYDRNAYEKYILGSAEVVGLMCLRVFCDGDEACYRSLRSAAMRLGAAFQKVNFLRDLHQDYNELARSYFPGIDIRKFSSKQKREIEREIEEDFRVARQGILRLPKCARFGVYVAFVYYQALLKKIQHTSVETLLNHRLSVSNHQKLRLLLQSCIRYSLGSL